MSKLRDYISAKTSTLAFDTDKCWLSYDYHTAMCRDYLSGTIADLEQAFDHIVENDKMITIKVKALTDEGFEVNIVSHNTEKFFEFVVISFYQKYLASAEKIID